MNELGIRMNDYHGYYISFSFALTPYTAVWIEQQVVLYTKIKKECSRYLWLYNHQVSYKLIGNHFFNYETFFFYLKQIYVKDINITPLGKLL